MPTQNQKQVFKNVMKKIGKGKKISISKEMEKVGYGEGYARNPQRLTRSKGWIQLLAQIDDEKVLERVYEIALEKKDKDANLKAAKMIFQLKDRYPNKKINLKVSQQDEILDEVK